MIDCFIIGHIIPKETDFNNVGHNDFNDHNIYDVNNKRYEKHFILIESKSLIARILNV